jgi:hypothetical protein
MERLVVEAGRIAVYGCLVRSHRRYPGLKDGESPYLGPKISGHCQANLCIPWGCTLRFTIPLSISMRRAARFENMCAVKVMPTQGIDATRDALLGHLYNASLSFSLVGL